MQDSSPLLIAVMGPTASGKSQFSENLADALEAELINADAFQVYRGLDIGTAKPTAKDRYHLLDLKDPDEAYGLGEFCRLSQALLERFWTLRRNTIVVGGTGLYVRALFEQYTGLQGSPPVELRKALQQDLAEFGLASLQERLTHLDPTAAAKVDLANPIRVTRALERLMDDRPSLRVTLPPFRRMKFALNVNPAALSEAIETRVRRMVQNGWVEEVKRLLELGFGTTDPAFRAIGYSELAACVLGQTDLEEATAATIAETRRYAKRQRTWLRSEPGLIQINTIGSERIAEAEDAIQSFCNRE